MDSWHSTSGNIKFQNNDSFPKCWLIKNIYIFNIVNFKASKWTLSKKIGFVKVLLNYLMRN